MDVEVDEADPPALGQVPGHRAEPDGAVAAEHERQLAGGQRRAHALGGLARAGHDGRQILRVRLLAVGPPAPHRRIAVIDDRDAAAREPASRPAARSARGAFSCPGA